VRLPWDDLLVANSSLGADVPVTGIEDDPANMRSWVRWMEVETRQDSGRWCREFVLLDDATPERQMVVITAVEVDPKTKCVDLAWLPSCHTVWQ
jgi:hypothetical protein